MPENVCEVSSKNSLTPDPWAACLRGGCPAAPAVLGTQIPFQGTMVVRDCSLASDVLLLLRQDPNSFVLRVLSWSSPSMTQGIWAVPPFAEGLRTALAAPPPGRPRLPPGAPAELLWTIVLRPCQRPQAPKVSPVRLPGLLLHPPAGACVNSVHASWHNRKSHLGFVYFLEFSTS